MVLVEHRIKNGPDIGIIYRVITELWGGVFARFVGYLGSIGYGNFK